MYWLLLISPIFSLKFDDCQVFYSSTTLKLLTNESFTSSYILLDRSSDTSQISSVLQNSMISCLVDLTYEKVFFTILDSLSFLYSTFYITVSRPESNSFSSHRFYSHTHLQSEAKALDLLIKYLDWQEFIIASCIDHDSLVISNYLNEKNTEKIYSFLKYPKDITISSAVVFIRKLIKVTGVQRLLIIDKTSTCTTFQLAVKENNLEKIGKYFMVSCRSPSEVILEGSLTLSEQGLEFTESYMEYEKLSIDNTLLTIINPKPLHIQSEDFSILNFKDDQINKVGKILNESVFVTSLIYYTGNTTLLNALENSIIPISIANGTTESLGYGQYYYMSNNYQGAIFAAKQINENKEIPKFEIELYPTDCGIYIYYEPYAKACYEPIANQLGIAYLAPLWDTVAEGTLKLLRKFNLSLPQISAMAISDDVDNKTAYPEFLKLTVSTANFFASGFLYQTYMKWLNVVLIATDDPISLATYNNVIKYSKLLGIKIVNDAKYQILPWQYTRDNFSQYEEYFIHAKNTKCRIYYILAWDRGLIWEALYDVGLRKGDFISITENAVIQYLWEGAAPEEFMKKRRELVEGTIIYKYAEWQGNLGQSLKSQLAGDLSYRCLTYDSMIVIKESINYILSKGDDFEDPSTLINSMRNIKFNGCTGLVYFASDSNSRGYCIFSFEQIRRNLTSNSSNDWYFVPVANVDKFSQTVVTPVGEYEWNFDTTGIPSNFLPVYECGIDPKDKRKSYWGYVILFCMCAAFALISIPPAMLAGYKFKRNIQMLTQVKQKTLADLLYLAFFIIQFLQIMSLGLNFEEFQKFYGDQIYILSLDFSYFFKLQFTNFWAIYLFFLTLSGIWTIFCMFIVCGYDLKELSDPFQIIISIAGHLFFMSIFSMLLSIFLCTESSSDSLLDSYLVKDCNIKCYQDKHLIYLTTSSIIITAYIFFTILCRPHWEFYQPSLNLFTSSTFLSILSVWEVIFVLINKTLQSDFKLIQGFISCFMVFALIFCVIWMNPYNYKRSKIMSLCSLSMAAWGLLTGVIFESVETNNNYIVIGIQIPGFALIFLYGMIRYYSAPELLKNETNNIEDLFRFQFGMKNSVNGGRSASYVIEPAGTGVGTRPEVTIGNDLN